MIVVEGKIIYLDKLSIEQIAVTVAYFEEVLGKTVDSRRLHR